jgi:hypothetical protein
VQHNIASVGVATVGKYSYHCLLVLNSVTDYVQAFEQRRGNLSQASSCGICGEQGNIKTSFSSIFGTETMK